MAASFILTAVACLFAVALAVEPQQVRLAVTAGPNANTIMKVVFATSNQTEASYVPTVQYSLKDLDFTNSAGCVSYNYTHEPAYQKSVFTHVCEITGLSAGVTYNYRVGDAVDGWSEVFQFTTPPPEGTEGFSVILYGDMGIDYSQPTVNLASQLIQAKQADLILHAGDISYADNRADINNGTIYEGILDDFYNEIQNASAFVPYMMSPGNHESIYDFIAYQMRAATSMPGNESGSFSPYWYSFDYGNAHFVAFSVEQPYNLTDPQGIWLLNDLQQAAAPENRTVRPWIIAYAHRPMWCSNDFWCPDTQPFRFTWEEIFNQYVDIFVAGHVHTYERIWPVFPNGTVVQENYENVPTTVHITSGSAGNMEVDIPAWYTPTPAWSAFRYVEVMAPQFNGLSHLYIANATHAHYQFINANTTEVVDDIWISKIRA